MKARIILSITFCVAALLLTGILSAQNVGINPTGASPNASALLDLDDSPAYNQGMLIPRMNTNQMNAITSPATSLMIYNTTLGCFMFYTSTAWQASSCNCSGTPFTPGAISSSTGSGSFCPGASGITYSISPVLNATGYVWTVPSGATIIMGQGSTTITVAEGLTAGNVSVSATNNCGTGAASTLAVTPIATNITAQPVNATACTITSASFTVTASGGGLTYQWQVSTNGGTSWSTVSNGGVYSGATTAVLTITSPASALNGYQYNCIVNGACSFTSNAATLTVHSLESVPITLTNTVATAATSANLPVMINVNFSTFSGNGEDANLDNVEFTTGPGGTGTPLNAWIESGSAPTAGTPTETAPSSSSTTAVVWVNLGNNTIAANGGTLTIYMCFTPSPIMTGSSSPTGIAPQWTTTYGQYDNGALVFPEFYDNFVGTTLASQWTNAAAATVVVNNSVAITYTTHNWYAIYTNTFASALNNVAESYCEVNSIAGQGLCINTSGTNLNGINNGTTGVDAQLSGPSASGYVFGANGSCTSAPSANATLANVSPSINTFYILSFFMLNTPVMQLSYGLYSSVTGTGTALNKISANSEVGLGASGAKGTYQWFRIRPNAPNSLLPGAVVGSYGCY